MASAYGDDRRAAMQARNELYPKDLWAAAGLLCLGETMLCMEPRRDDPRGAAWVFANPNGRITDLIHQLYQHTEVRLVPAMVLRQSYKTVPQMAREVELGAAPSGAKYP